MDEVAVWQLMHDLVEIETIAIGAAARAHDWYTCAAHLCERAWQEMRLRDLWTPRSERWHRWQEHMLADVAAARRIAARIPR